jgi:hypothetical protein
MSRRHSHSQPTYAERVGRVTGLVDQLAEARLERVTRTARRLFGTQAVQLVVWRNGQPLYQAGELGLPFAVNDLIRHTDAYAPRLVTLPNGVVVAIAPLQVERGRPSGCLLLTLPAAATFGPDELQSLADLAAWAEHELDMVRMGQTLALRLA